MAAGKTGLGAADTANVKTSIFEKVSYGMGDVVNVKLLEVDEKKKRISLSIKQAT